MCLENMSLGQLRMGKHQVKYGTLAYDRIFVLFSNLSMFLSSLSRPDAAGEEVGGLGPTLKEGLSGTQNKELK